MRSMSARRVADMLDSADSSLKFRAPLDDIAVMEWVKWPADVGEEGKQWCYGEDERR